jgi:hypothetical protein
VLLKIFEISLDALVSCCPRVTCVEMLPTEDLYQMPVEVLLIAAYSWNVYVTPVLSGFAKLETMVGTSFTFAYPVKL